MSRSPSYGQRQSGGYLRARSSSSASRGRNCNRPETRSVTHKPTQSDSTSQPETFIICIPNPNGKPASVEAGLEITANISMPSFDTANSPHRRPRCVLLRAVLKHLIKADTLTIGLGAGLPKFRATCKTNSATLTGPPNGRSSAALFNESRLDSRRSQLSSARQPTPVGPCSTQLW